MTRIPTVSKLASELRTGDIVQTNGMRVLLDGPVNCNDRYDIPVYWCNGLVLNRAEVSSAYLPLSWTSQADGSHRWQVQSNDRKRWAVEIPSTDGMVPTAEGYSTSPWV